MEARIAGIARRLPKWNGRNQSPHVPAYFYFFDGNLKLDWTFTIA